MKKDLIIQHYKNPKNWGEISNGALTKAENVSCGDSVNVYLEIVDGIISNAKFIGMGCSICLGTADILMDEIKGKEMNEIKNLPENINIFWM